MKFIKNKKLTYIAVLNVFIISIFIIGSCSYKINKEVRVIFVLGSSDLIRDGKTLKILPKMVINKGDTVKTGEGFVIVQIGDDILLRLQPNTSAEISKLFEDSETKLLLSNGQLISHVRKLSKENTFKIQTPTAVASVRGTMYSISYYKSRSVLAVREGKVELNSTQNNIKKTDFIDAGYSLIINKNKTRNISQFELLEIEKISVIPFSNNNDLNKDETFSRINETTTINEKKTDNEIINIGGPIPKTIEDMFAKYGYLNRIVLYNNKYYTGIITSRGSEVKIMTLDGFESIPFKQIKNIKRTGIINE